MERRWRGSVQPGARALKRKGAATGLSPQRFVPCGQSAFRVDIRKPDRSVLESTSARIPNEDWRFRSATRP